MKNSGVYMYQIRDLYDRLSSTIWLKVNELSEKLRIPIEISSKLEGIYVNSSDNLQKVEENLRKKKGNQFLSLNLEKGLLSEMKFPSKEFLPEEEANLEASAFYFQNILTLESIAEMKKEFDKTGKIVLRTWIFGVSDPKYSELSSFGNRSKKWERDPYPDNNYSRIPLNLRETIKYAQSR